MVKRILSVIKTGKPYQINKNLLLENIIKLPEDGESIWELNDYRSVINEIQKCKCLLVFLRMNGAEISTKESQYFSILVQAYIFRDPTALPI